MNQRALDAANTIAERLTDPAFPPSADRGRRMRPPPQSLADGAAGIALLHIERARTLHAGWDTVHDWLAAAVRNGVTAGPQADLFYGAPALAFATRAAADRPGTYQRALASLDATTEAVTRRRLDHAHARLSRGDRPPLAEFDVIRGLTGLGAHYLQQHQHHEMTRAILAYIVRLTEPLRPTDRRPGWWTGHGPTIASSSRFPGGHSNLGMAHGISGPLALLGIAMRTGVTVEGHTDAISAICAHLDSWRQDTEVGPWWPQWITSDNIRDGRIHHAPPSRPSWCYGTPGIARAQQIAAIATGDSERQAMAEGAIAACLSDPAQLDRITDTSLCHGMSGLFQIAWHAAHDESAPTISPHLPHLAEQLIQHAYNDNNLNPGLLTGTAGLALALHTAARPATPASAWDACLLINCQPQPHPDAADC